MRTIVVPDEVADWLGEVLAASCRRSAQVVANTPTRAPSTKPTGICGAQYESMERAPERRAMTLRDFARDYGISIKTAYREVEAGRLTTYKVGRRTLVAVTVAEEWHRARMGGRT